MSVSAVSAIQPSTMPDTLVPTLASENATTAAALSGSGTGPGHLHMFAADDDQPSFGDFLDVINPLQHIPIVNDIYREITGDKIGVGARLAGGALYGGPIGLIGAAINAVVEEATGHDIGGTVIAMFKDDEPSSTALASAPDPAAGSNPAAATQPAAPPLPAVSDGSGTGPKDDGDKSTARPMLLPDPAAGPLALAPAAPPAAATAAGPAKAAADAPKLLADASVPAASPAAEGKPMPVWGSREPRMMPVPPRTTPVATRSPPALGVPLSSTTSRSNTPITGARPAQPPMSPAMVQEMASAQAQAQTTAQAGTAASNEWFSNAMIEGLAKYQRSAKSAPASGQSVSDQQ